jgi:hypothetical protein
MRHEGGIYYVDCLHCLQERDALKAQVKQLQREVAGKE